MKRIYTLVLLFVVGLMHAQVGIGTTDPQGTLHIREDNGTQATPTAGTIILEHGDNGGASSIIFKSAVNAGNDYGYIMFQDDASGNGTTTENGLLTIGIENDTYNDWQDDININASGSLGINTNSPDPSSSIDLGRTNKGFLVNRVTLTGTTDTSTISNPATGLLVFNTANTSDVTQGFYYYNGSNWVRVSAKRYTSEFNQTSQVTASSNNTTYVDLPGLTQTFTAPYTGTYQFIINGYYCTGAPSNTTFTNATTSNGSHTHVTQGYTSSNNGAHTHTVTQYQDGVGQGSIRFTIDGNTVKEKYITATSKSFSGQTYYGLGQNATIVVNQQLTAGQTYTLRVQGREWFHYNSDLGTFGANTSVYMGNNGVSTAQYGTMTITLVAE